MGYAIFNLLLTFIIIKKGTTGKLSANSWSAFVCDFFPTSLSEVNASSMRPLNVLLGLLMVISRNQCTLGPLASTMRDEGVSRLHSKPCITPCEETLKVSHVLPRNTIMTILELSRYLSCWHTFQHLSIYFWLETELRSWIYLRRTIIKRITFPLIIHGALFQVKDWLEYKDSPNWRLCSISTEIFSAPSHNYTPCLPPKPWVHFPTANP